MVTDIIFKKQLKSHFEGIFFANDLSADGLLYFFDFAFGGMEEVEHDF